jgi:hypothetical protein
MGTILRSTSCERTAASRYVNERLATARSYLNGKSDLQAGNAELVMLASRVNDPKHLRERAAEMRASSKELKDNNTASILRLGELYDRLAGRAEVRSDGGMPPGET